MHRFKKRCSLILIMLLLVSTMLPALTGMTAQAAPSTTLSDPIYVYTAADLNNVRNNLSGNYIQMAHIDLGVSPWSDGTGWQPLGTESSPFTGSYNGNSFAIRNLTINRSGTNLVGLFAYTVSDNAMQLLNIRLTNASVTGNNLVGGLVGYALGPIDHCSVSGIIVGNSQVGGLVGASEKAIRNCTSEVGVRALDGGAGGLAGVHSHATISDCSSTGSVLTNYYGGGITGESRGNIVRSHASVSVSGLRDLGGLVGNAPISTTIIDACSASGIVDSGVAPDFDSFAGGLVGRAANRIMNSYATGEVNGKLNVGGLIGKLNAGGHVTRSRASGNVNGQENVGGLVGFLQESDIDFSYATGIIDGGSYIGGLVGRQDPGTGTSRIANSTAYGAASASSGMAGGLVGRSFGTKSTSTIINSRAYGYATSVNYVGGLVGFTDGLIKNCLARGSVQGANAGGLAGGVSQSGIVQASHATGNVTGPSTLGGLVGDTSAPIFCSSAEGAVTATDNYAGGLIGRARSTAPIISSYATGPVSGYYHVGGLVGESNGDIWNSYALGSAVGHSYVGGLCGTAFVTGAIKKDFFHCFSAGAVAGSMAGSNIGGLIGHMSTDIHLTNSYYNSTTSGQSDTGKGELRTTVALQSGVPGSTIFTDWSTGIWQFDPANEYPWHPSNKPLRIPADRLSGTNRYLTAVSVSQMGWGDCQEGSDTVILSVGTNFPDSLAGVPLAFSLNAPILLTTRDALPSSTRTEIERLGASKVIILGGTGAVSAVVADQVDAIPGVTDVLRIAGSNRYDTARLIAMEDALDGFNAIYLTSGADFPDALSAAAYAAQKGRPILLTGKTTLSNSVKLLLQEKPEINLVVIVGGIGAIADSVMAELHALNPNLTIQRISGANRYETSLKLADYSWPDGQEMFLATGDNFPDALAGGVLAALKRGGVVLVRSSAQTLPTLVSQFIDDHAIESGLILGGTSAVSSGVESALYQKLKE